MRIYAEGLPDSEVRKLGSSRRVRQLGRPRRRLLTPGSTQDSELRIADIAALVIDYLDRAPDHPLQYASVETVELLTHIGSTNHIDWAICHSHARLDLLTPSRFTHTSIATIYQSESLLRSLNAQLVTYAGSSIPKTLRPIRASSRKSGSRRWSA